MTSIEACIKYYDRKARGLSFTPTLATREHERLQGIETAARRVRDAYASDAPSIDLQLAMDALGDALANREAK